MDNCRTRFRQMRELAEATNEVIAGTALLGRALTHAYEFGDMTDREAADFVEAAITPLIEELARQR